MKILLTGERGQLGRAFQAEAKTRQIPHEVIPASHEDLDIADLKKVEQWLDKTRPDAVVNAAAYNFVDRAEDEPSQAFAINKIGPENLAKATAVRKIRLVHVSTDYVFDGTASVPYLESSPTRPLSVYGKSKEAGESAVLSNSPLSTVVRTAWLYHVGGRNFLLTMLSHKDKPELKVVDDQFGCPTYAPHLAAKILYLLESNSPGGIYHMAGKGQTTWYKFAKEFFKQLNISTPLKPISASEYPYRAQRPKYTVMATGRGKIFHLPSWEQGVAEFVKELKNGM